jgi:hypothetical protein
MSQRKPVTILKSLIQEEERKTLSSFPADRRIAIFELIRAIDSYFIYSLSLPNEKKFNEWNESEENRFIEFGINTALSLFIGEHCYKWGYLLGPSKVETQNWAASVLQRCGRVGACKMILDMNRFNLGKLELLPNHVIRYTPVNVKYSALEVMEAEEFSIVMKLVDELSDKERTELLAKRTEMIERMTKYVEPWREHYIRYDTTPEIDEYYEQMGLLWTRSHSLGADSFPGEAVFGGKSFNLYRFALMILVGWAWKHLDFCKALKKNHPELEWRNIITIPQDINVLSEYMAMALGSTIEEATQALSTLILCPENTHQHLSAPKGYLPPLVKLGEESVIKSIAGILDQNAYFFMLAELQRKYPSDYDRAVNLREEVFRQDLYLCSLSNHIYKAARPVHLKRGNKKITDIDAAFFDERNGHLGIFQLKWQDIFADSMRKRQTKMLNMMQEANAWIDKVFNWLEGKEPDTILHELGLDQVTKIRISRIYLFVLGRNYSHFSGDTEPDSRAAWGMWPQVLRVIKEAADSGSYGVSDPIGWLDTKLREESPIRKPKPDLVAWDFHIGDYHIVLEPSH